MTLPKDPLKREEYIQHQKEVQLKRFTDNPAEYEKFRELAKNRPPVSKETRKKQSEFQKKRFEDPLERKRISESLMGNTRTLGYKHTEKSKENMRNAAKIRPPITEETRNRERKSQSGHSVSKETREKISKTKTGKHPPPFTDEHKKNIGNGHRGKKVSDETKEKLRIINTGKITSEETRQKLRLLFTGRFVSVETRKKLSKSKLGHHHSEETKRKISVANRNPSEEIRSKMSILRVGKRPSKETIEKMCKNRKGNGNSNWKGGITPLFKQIRSGKKMKEWTRSVFERDNFKDWFSGCTGQIESHHIISFSKLLRKYNILSLEDAENCPFLWDINNGITLLKTSHKAYHAIWGKQQ